MQDSCSINGLSSQESDRASTGQDPAANSEDGAKGDENTPEPPGMLSPWDEAFGGTIGDAVASSTDIEAEAQQSGDP
jgi:hypothetical protein